ncbi:hypothetical protein K505DRAFT_327546 [Melanomma pulvis-pyrius CBS 109.77]|uniref:Uncharacterized protein n=1 Tax=Melanomma pulvis-pyrius CBS 109.77 TaxID=1314802 RepID=A0A6A6X2B2_9PLEO|nr:hypothetical protein K505DRAFT_327546 [Melanomma pulvis-pyrius CBS 109.77]
MAYIDEKRQTDTSIPPTMEKTSIQDAVAGITNDPQSLAVAMAVATYILFSSIAYVVIGDVKEILPIFWFFLIPFTVGFLSCAVIITISRTKEYTLQTRRFAAFLIPSLYTLVCLACYSVIEDNAFLLIFCFLLAPFGTVVLVLLMALVIVVANKEGL